MLMEQTMRWFGPTDKVSLSYIRQAGCSGVVTALHHIGVREVWSIDEINKRKKLVEAAGMEWTVIERSQNLKYTNSLPKFLLSFSIR